MPLLLVQKVRRAVRTAAQASAYRLAQRHFRPFTRAFETLADSVRGSIDKAALTSALNAGSVGAAVQALPLDLPERERRRLTATFEREYKAAVREAGGEEFKRLGLEMRFDLDNPYSVPWIERNAAEHVKRIGEETREVIRQIVAEGFRSGIPPAEMAREIRLSVGLLPRQVAAASSYRARLVAEGLPIERINSLDERYRARLLRQRSENIARTETISAEAQGLQDAWRVADDAGLILPGTRKRWLEAPSDRTCEVCESLGAQDPIDLSDSWETEDGETFDRPPAHPQCRCSMGLVLP